MFWHVWTGDMISWGSRAAVLHCFLFFVVQVHETSSMPSTWPLHVARAAAMMVHSTLK